MKRYARFSKKKRPASRRRSRPPRPRLAPQLDRIFKKIGVPSRAPFHPDPYQLEALEALRTGDVLVTAPTGSGKTWIAQEAMRTHLDRQKRSWYASPLKALSNSKHAEFSEIFGTHNVGILTGDRQERPDAPVIIGTTEILRNQLYDAMTQGRDIPVDVAILDEAHYLGDPDRGVVWEEVLIYLPTRVRLLLLSATVGNGEEISTWLEKIRNIPCHVVRADKRPVPLQFLFLFPDGELTPLASRKGILPRITKFLASHRRPGGSGSLGRIQFGWIIEQLRRWHLLPAIFFLKSRADCDHAIQRNLSPSSPRRDESDFEKDLSMFLDQYPFLKDHRQLPDLEQSRVASHHGGQLPQWKLLIEEMMNRGYLDAIYSTSTVAAGVNFPARTVVLVQSDRFDGQRFSDLTATELHQMTGRAGRRGKDRIGFALVLPGLYQDPLLIHQLVDSPPEPIRSQIQMSFSMVLNLLLSHHPGEIEDLLDRSLAAFQERRSHPELMKAWKRLIPKLKKALPEGAIPEGDPMDILKAIQVQVGLRERTQIRKRETTQQQREMLLSQYLKRGRLFVHKKGRVYVVFHIFTRQKRLYCSTQPLMRALKSKGREIKLKRIPVQSIDHLLDYRVDIPEEVSTDELRSICASIPIENLQPIRLTPTTLPPREDELRIAESDLTPMPDLRHGQNRAEIARNTQALLRKLEKLALRTDRIRHHLWNEFNRYLDFLRETGFVDEQSHLTDDGRWASKLRLDHPLLIAEAIRRGLFDRATPPNLAALIAPFVVDKTKEIEISSRGGIDFGSLREGFTEMVHELEPLQRLKRLRGFDTLQVEFWPAASLFCWASKMPWHDLIRFIPIEEGDMAMLILRTADHLRQLLDLTQTHPNLAETARQALPLILREPVMVA